MTCKYQMYSLLLKLLLYIKTGTHTIPIYISAFHSHIKNLKIKKVFNH